MLLQTGLEVKIKIGVSVGCHKYGLYKTLLYTCNIDFVCENLIPQKNLEIILT